jgi:hypothetical protein
LWCVPPKRLAMPDVSQRPYHTEKVHRTIALKCVCREWLSATRDVARGGWRAPLRHTPFATNVVGE